MPPLNQLERDSLGRAKSKSMSTTTSDGQLTPARSDIDGGTDLPSQPAAPNSAKFQADVGPFPLNHASIPCLYL